MNTSKKIVINTFLLFFCLLSSTGVFANGLVKLTDGLNVSTYNPMLGDQFRVSFSLRETENMPVSAVPVQVIMRDARGGPNILVSDFGMVSFEAGETIRFSQQYSLVVDLGLQEGTYAIAVGYSLPNGDVIRFDEENSADNLFKLEVSTTLLGYEGYIYGRTDKPEFRWVGRLPNGEFGHTWISPECAQLFGRAHQTGDWLQLSYLAPAGAHDIANPCADNLVNTNNVKLLSSATINPPNPNPGERFEVGFNLTELDQRPVTYSNIQISIEGTNSRATVDLGEVRFNASEGRRLSAVFDPSFNLEAGTYRAVVRYQLSGATLSKFEVAEKGDGANPQEFQIGSAALVTEGYVFGRTDSTELRWVSMAPSGELGHIWIDEQCAESLGGVDQSGTWADLSLIAPAGDQSVSNPCDATVDDVADVIFVNDGEGYVFSRSDSFEFRWISRTPTGEFGHTWIDDECARVLGGARVVGDWQRLIGLAPAGDQTVSSPCDGINSALHGSEGYVFARSDSPELRWIGLSSSGEYGHTWIDEQCAESLGGASAKGNWVELQTRAPAGDLSVDSPC